MHRICGRAGIMFSHSLAETQTHTEVKLCWLTLAGRPLSTQVKTEVTINTERMMKSCIIRVLLWLWVDISGEWDSSGGHALLVYMVK